ncbi:YeeE/YedE thiosulfate transporter family protein [Aliikangiella sp. G2MR2-5]|uniref:YeeE/YedE thiosulfate transporter family protein n=1 Tax=Aliikangiella sp. G2MR2-5 TaxID=2788943 RepID=UPI0018AC695D|nr:YeeE/YedE thiosulfate transporter family protein [Aliikangiella sp. G2MR2-5]
MTRQYINPYLAGIILGLILTASFLIAGRGLGASGAVAQSLAETLPNQGSYLKSIDAPGSLLESWIFIEVIGMIVGGFLSAKFSGRFAPRVIKGSQPSNFRRFVWAFSGGILMGFAARLARGCTSGQALSGGALLNTGSWAFMLAVFIGAYATCVFFKKEWR